MNKSIIILALLFCTSVSIAQINSFFVPPSDTNSSYSANQDDHLVVTNASISSDKLFIFIGGTSSTTNGYRTISNFAGGLGYDVINLSYPNTVAAASLSNDPNNLVFRNFRQEICYGTAVSEFITVDSLNSIYSRAVNLLLYLDESFPEQNWDEYLIDDETLDWSKIAIGGHSQGSGHAAYFAKFELVDRVLMFSGPNDFSDFFDSSAEWLGEAGVTSIDRHFAYLSLLDEVVDFDKQLSNLTALNIFPAYDTIHVDLNTAPYDNSRCLYTTQAPGIALLNHNSTVRLSQINNEVWTYMLEAPILSSTRNSVLLPSINVYPNPTRDFFKVETKFEDAIQADKVHIINVNGQVVFESSNLNQAIRLCHFNSGIYLVQLLQKGKVVALGKVVVQ